VALVVLARLVDAPSSLPLALAATGLLAGAAATLSRAAALALAVGLVVLAGLRGPRATVRAALGPCAGALVALVGLVPSMPAAGPARPVLALVGLGAGLALAAVLTRLRTVAAVALVVGGVLLGCVAVAVVAGGVGDAARLVAGTRITLASPDRSGAVAAALRVAAERPLTGAGPGQADLRWRGADGGTRFFGYAHNEYAQVAADLGLVGVVLLAILLVALGRLLWRARHRPGGRGLGRRGRGDGSLRRPQRLRFRLAPASGAAHRDAAGWCGPPGARWRRCLHTVPHRSTKGVR
jgi:hypothetical protein